MTEDNFTEEDKAKAVDFLNLVANKAKFEMNTKEIIEYFKLLQFMQGALLPKIDKHIFQLEKVTKAKRSRATKAKPTTEKATK